MSPQRTFREVVEVLKPPDLAQKDTQKGKSNFRRHQEMARNTGRARRIHMRRGIREEHDANHSGPAGDWAAGRGRHGGGAGVRMVETGRGRKGPSDGRTPGDDRDLGAGQGWQRRGQLDKERQ